MANGSVTEPIKRAVRAGVVLLCHLAVASVIIVGIRLLEALVHVLWDSGDPHLFGVLPLIYVFHGMDAGVLAVFVFWGVVEANRVFRGP